MIFLLPYIRWILALHVISMIAWMAGIFYLPRLFVYHCQVQIHSRESQRFKIMEHKLLHMIMLPAMTVTVITGGLLISVPGVVNWYSFWWPTKLIAACLMVVFQCACIVWQKKFESDHNSHTEKFYRMMNECPTILMIIIVSMVVIKPF